MAKIQLMTLDCSRVEYEHGNKEDKKTGRVKIDKNSIDLNEQSLRKHRERLAKQQIEEAIPIDITDKFKNI